MNTKSKCLFLFVLLALQSACGAPASEPLAFYWIFGMRSMQKMLMRRWRLRQMI